MSHLPQSPRMYAALIMRDLELPITLPRPDMLVGTMQDYLTDMIERAIADHNRVLVETTLAQRQLKREVNPRKYPSDQPAPDDPQSPVGETSAL
jgi:hypothetical protein